MFLRLRLTSASFSFDMFSTGKNGWLSPEGNYNGNSCIDS